jgi:carboxylate-amine ligase
MNHAFPLAAFAGYGVELEYMIVDRQTLSVLPIADELLHQVAGEYVAEVRRGGAAWSNELMLHLVELKNPFPIAELESLPAIFQAEIGIINRLLEPLGARLMPSAMHPWMDPHTEARLWPHQHADIYQTYDRIFDCKRHGWANLQSMHLNLPFADDHEFARLHAAIRLVLPILPALAASSPMAEGQHSGFMDFRMENYRRHEIKIPSLLGQVIPDTVTSRAEYEQRIFAVMYRDIAPCDPAGVLRQEWLNARGVIPRFDRSALEIRVIDVQECPQADLAIAAATIAVVRALYQAQWAPLEAQQAFATSDLVKIMLATIRDADEAIIDNVPYLRLLGFPHRHCQAGELWQYLVDVMWRSYPELGSLWQEPLEVILQRGPLARRISRAVGTDTSRDHLQAAYRELCNCLDTGQMFKD